MPESVTDRPTRSHEYLFLLSKRERYYYDAEAIKEPHTRVPFGGNAGYAPATKDHHTASQATIRHGTGRMGNPDGGRNKRSVWTIPTQPYAEAHFAVMPEALVEPCILAGSRPGDTILDPFVGSGTVPLVAARFNRRSIGIDLNADYLALAERRLMRQPMAMTLEATP